MRLNPLRCVRDDSSNINSRWMRLFMYARPKDHSQDTRITALPWAQSSPTPLTTVHLLYLT